MFACRSGRRSVTASLAAQEQGFAYDAHMAGGILAWKAAGPADRDMSNFPLDDARGILRSFPHTSLPPRRSEPGSVFAETSG